MPSGSSTPSSAEDEVYRHVLTAICVGRYRPGDRLIAEDIAGEVGVSRMPVRSAFQRLAAESLVTLRPHRGAVVSGMDAAAMQEVFEIRSALEGLAVRLALPHIRAREIKRLERLLEDMDDCHAEPAEWIERHHAFHEYLCSLADRPRLLRQINGLHTLIEPHMRLWLAHVGNPHLADDEHRAIIAALRNGDPTAATKVICEHIEGTVPELLRFIERAKGPNA